MKASCYTDIFPKSFILIVYYIDLYYIFYYIIFIICF